MAYISSNAFQYGNSVGQSGVRPLQPSTAAPGAQGAGAGTSSPAGVGPGSTITPAPGNQAGATGGQAGAPGTGWVNLQNVFGLNQAGASSMADRIAAPVEAEGAGVASDIAEVGRGYRATPANRDSPGYAADPVPQGLDARADRAGSRARDLGTSEGQQGAAMREFGRGGTPYSRGDATLDSFLAGTAGQDRFGRIANLYGNLSTQLGNAEANRARHPTDPGPIHNQLDLPPEPKSKPRAQPTGPLPGPPPSPPDWDRPPGERHEPTPPVDPHDDPSDPYYDPTRHPQAPPTEG